MKKIFFIVATITVMLASCVDLNITPKSILTADDIFNEAGIKAYFAGIYSGLPMEDFRYDRANGNGAQSGYFSNLGVAMLGSNTGELVCANNDGGWSRHATGYWGDAFKLIRQANTLIVGLPDYPSLGSAADEWIAEAKFIRAYVYSKLAIRYGGLPKVLEPQYYDPSDETTLYVARLSHEETYDFILKDFDEAIEGLPARSDVGRANKYVAAAIKSRVALHAATTARYGSQKFADWSVDGVLLQGIPAGRANSYFQQAWDAAKLLEGVYALHKANADKTENYAEVFTKPEANSNESIWIRKYLLNSYHHSYDCLMLPSRFVGTYGNRGGGPTLDWVELFDGIPLNEKGQFHAFDENGNYTVYDDCQQMWNGVEPRLRANLLLPGVMVNNVAKLDMRAGLIDKKYDPAVHKFKKFSADLGTTGDAFTNQAQWGVNYQANPFEDLTTNNVDETNPAERIIIWRTPGSYLAQTLLYNGNDGLKIMTIGRDGPRINIGGVVEGTRTGMFLRKYLNPSLTAVVSALNLSTQTWIEIRYAEVLLNRAEAAIELSQNGVSSYGGANMLQDAFTCINSLRDRAGADLLASESELSTEPAFLRWNSTAAGEKGKGGFVLAPNRGLQIVRVERYKELAFENKLYWDLLRWFTFDEQIRTYIRRGLFPFMYASGATMDGAGFYDGKYIYDGKSVEAGGGAFSFPINDYYEGIPTSELQNNPLLQKNRNQ